jgi:UDP-glucose 4-epimerase
MAVLVTGGAGYIGSVTVELLRANGEEPIVLDNLSRGHREAVDPEVKFYQGDIADRELVLEIVRSHSIDACIHFAAFAYVGESVENPAIYFENNASKCASLLSSLIEGGVRRVVFSSTCATYGEPKEIPISETHPQWPANPYGWSKLFVEQILSSFDRAYSLKFVALRYFNAAGAYGNQGEFHDPETHLIPNVLNAAAGLTSHVSVFGTDFPTPDGTAVRDYIHVADLASAHLLAVEYLRAGRESNFINLGNGNGHSVLEVIQAAREVTGKPIKTIMEPRRAGDPSHLVAKADKAQSVLGWKPEHPEIADMIGSAWEWLQNHPEGYPHARKS